MNAEERKKLKDQVMSMVLSGYSYADIGHKLGIAKRTIIRYVKDERGEQLERMQASAEEHMADYESAKQKRMLKMWTIALDESKKDSDRLKAMALLQNEDDKSMKRKQLIGMIPPEAPLVAIQNNNMIEGVTTIADSIRRKCPELLEKFHKNKMKVLKEKQGENND